MFYTSNWTSYIHCVGHRVHRVVRRVKSVTLNRIVCINRLHCIEHLLRCIEHLVRRMEHPVHRKYPILYVLLGALPIEPFIVHIEMLKNKSEKCQKN